MRPSNLSKINYQTSVGAAAIIFIKRYCQLLFLLAIISLGVSCKKSTDVKPVSKKMVLVYMEANNDLRYDALNSINSMEKGAANLDGTLLVYIKTNSSNSYLLKIKHDEDGNRIVSDTVKTFGYTAPSDPNVVKQVMLYAQSEFPAQSYGLILWSHATSWAPASTKVKVQSFGSDSGKEMDIIDLKNALPDNLSFIVFDACSMGGVEVLYEFKDKAKYIIASPTETLSESFPYQKIVPLLFQDDENLSSVAKAYFNYYNAYTDDRQSATVVLVKTSELTPLATGLNTLMHKQKKYGDQLISTGVQRLDYTANFPVANYDFGDYLDHNFTIADLSSINLQLNKTILYKAATANFIGVPIKKFSGLTCAIPYTGDANLSYYQKLQWYTGAGLDLLFRN
ncbi:clostripain-related cysteine peptidase [Mucilaginibacter jinjuensis]|uniref:Clostripain-related cysteine peptidase n=1 Tax=Mucilaginibacter jinjuensis TaxID=1176721 RepID=A0ABY7T756_9SPHI|nr:clostripain-related cysteine peptidase [Mucilaginibacter jinjuensis]WCT11573.1 clostripain-related cysteine peptidase [Mucilaginibacter jinjuensis]